MLLRHLRGQPPSHHTVENPDVRNSFLLKVLKVHAIWHLSVYLLGQLLITILGGSAMPPQKVPGVEGVEKKTTFFH